MINIEPSERPWEDSTAFKESVQEALRARVEDRLRRELVGANELFMTDEGTPFPRLSVSVDADGLKIEVIPPDPKLKQSWDAIIAKAISDETGNLPMDKAKELVKRNDPLSMGPLPPGEWARRPRGRAE